MSLTPDISASPRFRRLLLNAVLIPVILMVVVAGLLVWQVQRLVSASYWVEHTDLVLSRANELFKLTLDLETGLRGYLVTGADNFLEPYNNALKSIEQKSDELRNLVSDNPSQQQAVDQIKLLRIDWLDYVNREIQLRQKGGDFGEVARAGGGKQRMDAMRMLFHQFISTEEGLRDERAQTARRISQRTLIYTLLGTVAPGGLFAGISRRQFKQISAAYDAILTNVNDLNATLEKRVADRTAELERRSGELSELNRELEAFAYSISHDLRAPLRHIGGFADLLRKSRNTKFDSEAEEYVSIIADTSATAGRMVDELLAFSRIGRAPLQISPVQLNPLVNQCIKEIAPDIGSRQIEWVIAPLPTINGDPALLKLAFLNLIGNAVKYTGKKEASRIELGIISDPSQIPAASTSELIQAQDESLTPANMVTLFLRDNGIGFDMEYAPKLFGVFQRLHRAEEFEGTGIGLANVRRIIMRHGGRVWAQGMSGQGATFYFTLPLAQETVAQI